MSIFFKRLVVVVGYFAAACYCRNYTYYDYDAMEEKILQLEATYPSLIRVTTAQAEYGLQSPGDCGRDNPCVQYIVHITNFETYEDDKASRPEVFFSGCLHGNERVGPTTLVETLELLAKAHTEGSNPWLKRLVDTRSIFMMPATNALGYYRNARSENGIDPNRDFAIDVADPTQCMQTITARSVNELFREHMFQLSITFHSGIRMLGYEWGDITHEDNYFSPDDTSQATIGSALSAYAGKFDSISPVAQGEEGGFPPFPDLYNRFTYPNGPITPLVYAVEGGMEDWAYAGSWADNRNVCNPTTFGGYDTSRTVYTDDMLRCFNMLVESDDNKEPAVTTLGTDEELLRPTGAGTGHIPRHIRLVLTMIEAVQPYFKFVSFKHAVETSECSVATLDKDLTEELVNSDDVNEEIVEAIANPGKSVSVAYEIGGGFSVNSTRILVYMIEEEFDESKVDYTLEDLEAFDLVYESESVSGFTRWSGGGLFGSPESKIDQGFTAAFAEIEFSTTGGIDDREKFPFIPAWKFCFDAPTDLGEYLIFATAQLDQNWADIPDFANPTGLPLQAHLSQARTNTSWDRTNNGFVIKGKVDWVSRPLLLKVTNAVATDAPTPSPTTIPPTPAPSTAAPTTLAPTTKAPTTKAPTSKSPTTEAGSNSEDEEENSPGLVAALVILVLVAIGLVLVFAMQAFKKPLPGPASSPEQIRNGNAKAKSVAIEKSENKKSEVPAQTNNPMFASV